MMIYAHRGASGYAPENTMAAFREALRLGADGIELDVQLTRDGEAVVLHDHTIDRTSNGRGWLKDFTLAELRQYDFGSWFDSAFRGEPLPTLDETLAWLAPTALRLNIEIKNGPVVYSGLEDKVAVALARFHMEDRVIISSFDHLSLQRIKALNPRLQTGVLFYCRPVSVPALARDCDAAWLHPHWQNLDAGWVEEARAAGLGINVYTINQADEYRWISGFAVDGIFSNYPDAAARW
jgi:glycerophosphoryl diester phosphodiesterase